MNINDLKKEFLFTENFINLNNAGMCPPPARSVDFINNYHSKYAQEGLKALIQSFGGLDHKVRTTLAKLLDAETAEIALTHNTAVGINIIAQGYPFKKGDTVISAGKEYPANIYPWMNLEKKGVDLILIPETNGATLLQDIEAAIDTNVKMITISFVAWTSGYKNDMKALGDLCHSYNIPLVVDGAQGVGALNLSMKETGISALACPAWKWLWGPLGLGFLYMKPSFMEKISPVFVGADGVQNADDLLNFELIPKNNMTRFEYATKNYADIVQFSKSLELTMELGISTIETKLHEITDEFKNAVTKSGGIIYGDFEKINQSGIFSFTLKDMEPEIVKSKLAEKNIIVNVRDNRIRIAPHVYLNEEDVSQFKKALETIS